MTSIIQKRITRSDRERFSSVCERNNKLILHSPKRPPTPTRRAVRYVVLRQFMSIKCGSSAFHVSMKFIKMRKYEDTNNIRSIDCTSVPCYWPKCSFRTLCKIKMVFLSARLCFLVRCGCRPFRGFISNRISSGMNNGRVGEVEEL